MGAAQTAKAPFARMADRFALLLLPVTLVTAGGAWWFSGDPIRALAVLGVHTGWPSSMKGRERWYFALAAEVA